MLEQEIKELVSYYGLNSINQTLHLGIFTEPCLTYMLEGKKTIESRFSKHKIAPYYQIKKEDIVLIKKSSGPVIGYFTIKDILFFDLKEVSIEEIRRKYQKELCVSNEFWKEKQNSNYATLIFIDKITCFEPINVHKKGMQSWIVIQN